MLGKCDNRISTDVIKCYTCKLDFHTQCYGLVSLTTKAVNANSNLLFLCDNCLAVAHPASMVSFASEVTQLKSAVVNMATEINTQTAKSPPSELFATMVSSLNEINKSLKSINEDREATAEQDVESLAILNDIKATLNNVEAHKPLVNTSELVSLMNDVRAALRDENRGASGVNQNQINIPFKFGQTVGGKRRLGQSNDVSTPKKRTRTHHTVCTGQVDTELLTVEPLQSIETGKSMVASRFAPTTSSSAVLSYVKRNLSLAEESDEVSVRSLAPRGRPLSELTFISFKITASEELYSKLMDANFWPANTTIREFEKRENPQTAVFQ